MVDRLVAVNDADYRLPETVLQALGADVPDAGTSLGGAVQDSMVAQGGKGISPFHPMFGALGDGTSDDSAALQAFLNYVTANDVGVANVQGNFRSSVALTMGAALTKVFAGKCQITFTGSGAAGLTVAGWANGLWQYLRLVGPQTGAASYAGKTWHTGLHLTNGTSRSAFTHVDGNNWAFSLVATSGGNTTACTFGVIKATDCGSGALRASDGLKYGLSTAWSNLVNTGSSGSTAQTSTITVATLPPSFITDGYHGAVGESPYFVRVTENTGKKRLHFIKAINTGASTIDVFPWIDPATTNDVVDYQWGGALFMIGSDSNVHSWSMVDATRCGISVSIASLYGPVGGRVVSQACGASIVIGGYPSAGCLGGVIQSGYFETGQEDVVYLSRPGSVNVTFSLGYEYALNLAKCYVVSAPRLATTYADSSTYQGFEGTALTARGKPHRFEKRPFGGAYLSPATIVLDRPDMQVPLIGNSFTVNVSLDIDLHRLFGYDSIQFLASSSSGGAPSGSITFPAPSGYTINGGAGPVVFSGLTSPTRFLYRFDTVAMNVVVTAVGGAGGGTSPYQFVRATTDSTVNNVATLADDAVLTLPVEANAVYRFNALIDYSAATTADFLYGFTGPSGSTARFRGESMASNASATTSPADNGGKGLNTGITAGALGVGARALMAPSGLLIVGGTPGFFTFRWSQAVAEVSDATRYAQSWMEITKVG